MLTGGSADGEPSEGFFSFFAALVSCWKCRLCRPHALFHYLFGRWYCQTHSGTSLVSAWLQHLHFTSNSKVKIGTIAMIFLVALYLSVNKNYQGLETNVRWMECFSTVFILSFTVDDIDNKLQLSSNVRRWRKKLCCFIRCLSSPTHPNLALNVYYECVSISFQISDIHGPIKSSPFCFSASALSK